METTTISEATNGLRSFLRFDDLEAFLGSWSRFYDDVYGVKRVNQLLLPPLRQALGAGVVMLPGITIEQDLAEIKKCTQGKKFYRYTERDIDSLIQKDKEPLRPQSPYAVWAYPAVEATGQSSQLAKKSYDDIQTLGTPVMLFREYTRFFLWHLWATDQPLDRKSMTLSGSLVADGGVLSGGWRGGRFGADWYGPDDAGGCLRARQVVLPLLA